MNVGRDEVGDRANLRRRVSRGHGRLDEFEHRDVLGVVADGNDLGKLDAEVLRGAHQGNAPPGSRVLAFANVAVGRAAEPAASASSPKRRTMTRMRSSSAGSNATMVALMISVRPRSASSTRPSGSPLIRSHIGRAAAPSVDDEHVVAGIELRVHAGGAARSDRSN